MQCSLSGFYKVDREAKTIVRQNNAQDLKFKTTRVKRRADTVVDGNPEGRKRSHAAYHKRHGNDDSIRKEDQTGKGLDKEVNQETNTIEDVKIHKENLTIDEALNTIEETNTIHKESSTINKECHTIDKECHTIDKECHMIDEALNAIDEESSTIDGESSTIDWESSTTDKDCYTTDKEVSNETHKEVAKEVNSEVPVDEPASYKSDQENHWETSSNDQGEDHKVETHKVKEVNLEYNSEHN